MNLINNRQNGRRRGRGGSGGGGGQRQGGGGQGPRDSGNRIDSRARGNASQLLEKYRNMARDAQMSGDRVQTEYYLQFADHYFRVLADQRGRFEERGEQQPRRQRDDFDQFDNFDGDDFEDEAEIRAEEAPAQQPAEPRRSGGSGRDRGAGEGRQVRGDGEARSPRGDGETRSARGDGESRAARGDSGERMSRPVPVANDVDGGDDSVPERGRRRGRRPAVETDGNRAAAAPADAPEGIADRLPPSFGFAVEGERGSEGEPSEEAPRPRRRRTRAAGGEVNPAG